MAVLNQRLNNDLQSTGLLNEEQAGFRKHYNTADHEFSLKMFLFVQEETIILFILIIEIPLIQLKELLFGENYIVISLMAKISKSFSMFIIMLNLCQKAGEKYPCF